MFIKTTRFITFLVVLSLGHAFASQEIIKRKHYVLNYNEEHEVANWVSYELEKNHLRNCVKRANNFKSDPMVSTGSATVKDYSGSGYDKGHLVPAGDMKFSHEAMNDTFFLSNITPQPAGFNRGQWSQLETLIRAWAFNYQKVWIVTGPILEKGLDVIGKTNDISVPLKYFKVILRKSGSTYEGMAFLMDTDVPYLDLESYVSTIDEVEKLSGYDYFSFLDDSIESKIESRTDIKKWNFNAKFDYLPCGASVVQ